MFTIMDGFPGEACFALASSEFFERAIENLQLNSFSNLFILLLNILNSFSEDNIDE